MEVMNVNTFGKIYFARGDKAPALNPYKIENRLAQGLRRPCANGIIADTALTVSIMRPVRIEGTEQLDE
jgi:hypothetical protein